MKYGQSSGGTRNGQAVPIPVPIPVPWVPGLGELVDHVDRLIEETKDDIADGVQYTLRVKNTRPMPNLEWGKKYPTGTVQMYPGEIWKIGETTKWDGVNQYRYTQKWLDENNLIFVPEYEGNVFQIKSIEKLKLIQYSISNGNLPPGNKIFR